LQRSSEVVFANSQTLEYAGLAPDEVSAGDFRERVFHPEDVERLRPIREYVLHQINDSPQLVFVLTELGLGGRGGIMEDAYSR